MNGERFDAPSIVPPISAKPIRWSPDGDRAWTGSMGFHIEFDAEEPPESRFTASWGEGDSEEFPTIDEARAWCQALADGWIREFGKVSTQGVSTVVARTLTFEALRRANVARCEKWHPAGIDSWSPSDWLTAVTGELGELASLLKMRNRERDGLPGNKFSPTEKQIADELADVLTYLDLLAAVLDVDLGRAAVEKFNDVSERVGFPDRISLVPEPTPQADAQRSDDTFARAWRNQFVSERCSTYQAAGYDYEMARTKAEYDANTFADGFARATARYADLAQERSRP